MPFKNTENTRNAVLGSLIVMGMSWGALAEIIPSKAGTMLYTTLDNGLKVIALADQRLPPVAAVQVWYNVGSADEQQGQTGLSHFLEHLMFKGTPQALGNRFMALIEGVGGRANAGTDHDFTFYHEVVPLPALGAILAHEADRMSHLVFDSDSFSKELQVVKEERRLRTDDVPQGRLFEKFRNIALSQGPYASPVIGWMQDLNHLHMEQARLWYNTWYTPNNAVLVIVGKIDPEQVLNLVKLHFGSLVLKTLPQRKPLPESIEPHVLGGRRLELQEDDAAPWMFWGFNLPHYSQYSPGHKEALALEVLGLILAGKSSSRINQRLYHEQNQIVDASVQVSNFTRYPDLFTLQLQLQEKADFPTVEAAMWKEIENLKQEGITPQELKTAKLQALADRTFVQDDLTHRALEYGYLETVGVGWKVLEDYLPIIESLNEADIQAVAQKYLQPEALTIAVLKPKQAVQEKITASVGEKQGEKQ